MKGKMSSVTSSASGLGKENTPDSSRAGSRSGSRPGSRPGSSMDLKTFKSAPASRQGSVESLNVGKQDVSGM